MIPKAQSILGTDKSIINMAKIVILAAACLAVVSAGIVRRETPAALADIEKHAAEFQKTFTEQYSSLVNSQHSKDFQKALKDGSDNVLQHLSAFSNALQGALMDASGKTKTAIESTSANLQKHVENFRKQHPEVEQQATAARDNIQAAVNNAFAEAQKLAKEVQANAEETNKKLAVNIKAAYEDFVKQIQGIQKKLHDASKP